MVGDDKRYGKLKAPIGDGLFAAYDPLDMKAAKYLIVAGSDYLYTPRSLFWPDVIFLTAPKLDWGQAIGMMISVRRVVSMEPQLIVVAGSNDHLQSRGLLSRLTDGSIPSNEVIGEAIMTLLSAMAEVEAAARQRFTMNVVKVIFVLSPGYAALPEPLQFVYTMVTTIAEGIFNVIIPAPNRVVDTDNYYPSRSELPAVWADISNAIQGLRDCSTTRLVLDEILGLELSNFAGLLKLRPGVDDDHLLVQQVADDLWFRQMDHAENEQGRMIRKNMTSAEEDLMAMALRTKPQNNVWLYLSPRLCTLGEDAFEHAPAIIKEIHVYLKNLFDARELAGGKMLKLMTDVNLITALGFCSMTSSIESLERLERAHELVTSLSLEIFPGALQTEQKIGGWREALENEMNLKDSEAYHRPTGSKYMVGSSSAPYCNSKYPTHMVVMDARTQQVLVDQLFSVPKCVRLARMSERSYDLLAKNFRAVPKRSEGELQDVVGEEFMRLNEGNVSEFEKQKASGALPTEFPTIEEKDDLHRILMEVEPLLGASGYRTRRNIVRTHGEYPCHCLAQTLWYPKRGNLILVWDVEELYSTGLPDQNQQVSIVVVSAMLAVRWLEANADTSQQETAVPTPEQLSNVKMSRELDLFRTTCKVLRIPKAIERIWSRQRLMPWFRAVMTSWNTEAYQSFQLDIGPGAYKRAFLTHRNAVTTAVKRVAGTPCVTEDEKKEVLRADLERNVSLCLHNSFCRNREQKVNVDLLPCCKPRLLEQESWGTARNSMDMLKKVLEDSEDQDGEVME